MPDAQEALDVLHPAVCSWFVKKYGKPSLPQQLGWPAIAAGESILLLAPTGSGKTLAAFLQCISYLYQSLENGEKLDEGVRVLYVSPLKSLNNDIYKNLEEPLQGIAREARTMGIELPQIKVSLRTGDTSPAERRSIRKHPPHILITTPESLGLMLASGARSILSRVCFVIIDEIHALFPNKRGALLTLALESLETLTGRSLQRIGLSATQRPLAEISAFLGGGALDENDRWRPRPVRVIDTGQRKVLDLHILLPVEDLRSLPEKSIWPSIYRKLLDEVKTHQSTLIFVNNRRLAERVTTNLNDLAGHQIAQTHHGSLSKEKRLDVETRMKSGKLACIVATSSLELGIDVGSIDLVIQVESPKEVARGLQRVGRAGHIVGMPSAGSIIPKSRGDLLECAMIMREMREGKVEATHAPENALDILAQHIVASVAVGPQETNRLFQRLRSAYPYRSLPRALFDKVVEMLAGLYDDGRFSDLKPCIFLDRVQGRIAVTERGRRLVYTNGGTIPDRGYFGVYLAGTNQRLGELDEEFVAERRLGERFSLGTTTWRIEEIRKDRVIVTHAARGEAMVPFWKGEALGRSFELGQRFGAFLEEAETHLEADNLESWMSESSGITNQTGHNLSEYLRLQKRATGYLPTQRRIIVEEFRDELGEWRVVIHSWFGARLNTPLAMLICSQLEKKGVQVEVMQDDNAILLVAPGGNEPPVIDWQKLAQDPWIDNLTAQLRRTHLFAMVFRQNAARALLLPKGAYGRGRTPLWLARLRAADLLQTVSEFPDFPILTETFRECFTEIFDIKALDWLMAGLRDEKISIHYSRRQHSSPFTHTLQFNFFGNYMYVQDLPKGELRFKALGMDRDALRELIGIGDLRTLFNSEIIREVDEEARGYIQKTLPRSADEFYYWLLQHGEWRSNAGRKLTAENQKQILMVIDELQNSQRIAQLTWNSYGEQVNACVTVEDLPDYLAAVENCRLAGKDIDALMPPADRKEARHKLSRRFARTHGPFTARDLAEAYAWEISCVEEELAFLEASGVVQQGEFTQGVKLPEWCEIQRLRRIHRQSLSKARRAVEPRRSSDYATFLARWQHVIQPLQNIEGLRESLIQLAGLALPGDIWEEAIFPIRVESFQKSFLDRVIGEGEVAWQALGTGETQRVLFFVPGQISPNEEGRLPIAGPEVEKIREILSNRGAMFVNQILQGSGLGFFETLDALKTLMENGEVTNDSFEPIRRFPQQSKKNRGRFMGTGVLSGMGRWSLIRSDEGAALEQWAELLLRRYGVVTSNLVSGHGPRWNELGPIYEKWEMIGKIRRGYFVENLGGIQYALPEAVEELRRKTAGDHDEYWVLHWYDPANPYQNVLEMPLGFGEFKLQPDLIVFHRGRPVMIAGGKRLRLAVVGEENSYSEILKVFAEFCRKTQWSKGHIMVTSFNGRPILETAAAEHLAASGFERGYNQMTWWGAL